MIQSHNRAYTLGLLAALAVPAIPAWVAAQAAPAALTVESPAYQNGGAIPDMYGANGAGVSPPLTWKGAPASTKEYTVILEDMDNNFVHWTIYKIPGTATGLPENVPAGATLDASAGALAGAMQGPAAGAPGGRGGRGGAGGPPPGARGGAGGPPAGGPPGGAPPTGGTPPAAPAIRYRPPGPPAGMPHHYRFTVYALDAAIAATPGMTKPMLVETMTGHIIAQGELTGVYSRK